MSGYIIASVILAALRLGGSFKRTMDDTESPFLDIVNNVGLNTVAVIAGVILLCIQYRATP